MFQYNVDLKVKKVILPAKIGLFRNSKNSSSGLVSYGKTIGKTTEGRGSNPRPTGCMRPRMAMNVAQHKIVNVLKTLGDFFVCDHLVQCI